MPQRYVMRRTNAIIRDQVYFAGGNTHTPNWTPYIEEAAVINHLPTAEMLSRFLGPSVEHVPVNVTVELSIPGDLTVRPDGSSLTVLTNDGAFETLDTTSLTHK